jgi:hypothetical protein
MPRRPPLLALMVRQKLKSEIEETLCYPAHVAAISRHDVNALLIARGRYIQHPPK